MDDAPIKIITRDPTPEDKNFILSCWLKGQYFGSPYFSHLDEETYYREYALEIVRIMSKDGVNIRVACNESSPEWVVGFAVYEGQNLYWVYVKLDYRRRGIAKLLLHNNPIQTIKTLTNTGACIIQDRGMSFVYQPEEIPCQLKQSRKPRQNERP